MIKTISFRSAFSFSYELKHIEMSDQEFCLKFIEFLFLNKCIAIESHIPKTIVFFHNKEDNFENLSESIEKYFSHLVYYQFAEIKSKYTCDGINCDFLSSKMYSKDFDNLVSQVQKKITL